MLRRKDMALPLAAAVLFGAGAPMAKALASDAGAQAFAGILYLGSGLGLGAARLVWRTAEEPLHRRDLRWLAMSTMSGGIVAPILLVWGLQRTSGSTASLLLNVDTMLTAAVAWFVFGEHRHARSLVAVAVIWKLVPETRVTVPSVIVTEVGACSSSSSSSPVHAAVERARASRLTVQSSFM